MYCSVKIPSCPLCVRVKVGPTVAYFLSILCLQSCLRAFELLPFALFAKGFVTNTMIALMAGCFMIHHCANTITNSGIGNGSTLVICMGIISGKGIEPASEQYQDDSCLVSCYDASVLHASYLHGLPWEVK